MKRFGQVLQLKPECINEYVKYHADVWPGVLAQIKKSNIQNYSIFLQDNVLFAYFEHTGNDFEQDMKKMALDAETQRWWAVMEPMQEKWATASAEEWWCNMTEVFHLE